MINDDRLAYRAKRQQDQNKRSKNPHRFDSFDIHLTFPWARHPSEVARQTFYGSLTWVNTLTFHSGPIIQMPQLGD
jgi:hypothetical protein